jgi:hypothetical protein
LVGYDFFIRNRMETGVNSTGYGEPAVFHLLGQMNLYGRPSRGFTAVGKKLLSLTRPTPARGPVGEKSFPPLVFAAVIAWPGFCHPGESFRPCKSNDSASGPGRLRTNDTLQSITALLFMFFLASAPCSVRVWRGRGGQYATVAIIPSRICSMHP